MKQETCDNLNLGFAISDEIDEMLEKGFGKPEELQVKALTHLSKCVINLNFTMEKINDSIKALRTKSSLEYMIDPNFTHLEDG